MFDRILIEERRGSPRSLQIRPGWLLRRCGVGPIDTGNNERNSRPYACNPKSNFASGGGLDTPLDLLFGPDGNLYFVKKGRGGLGEPTFMLFGPPVCDDDATSTRRR